MSRAVVPFSDLLLLLHGPARPSADPLVPPIHIMRLVTASNVAMYWLGLAPRSPSTVFAGVQRPHYPTATVTGSGGSPCHDGEHDWQAEVGDISDFAPQGIHQGRLSPSPITARPAVRKSLELCLRLNTALITDHFNYRRPGTSLLVYFSGILSFPSDCEGFLRLLKIG